MKRGAFIVLEGCDRCGKSTQSQLLVEKLNSIGVSVEHMGFPVRSGQVGQMIHDYLTNKSELPDQSIHLLFSANRWELMKKMKEKLEAGTTLIVDRYYPSGIAYSVAKGMDYDWCKAPEIGLIEPDAVLFLKDSISNLAKRGNFGEERYEKIEFQGKVADVYDRMCAEQNFWHVFDASLPKETLSENLTEKSIEVISDVENVSLKTLQ